MLVNVNIQSHQPATPITSKNHLKASYYGIVVATPGKYINWHLDIALSSPCDQRLSVRVPFTNAMTKCQKLSGANPTNKRPNRRDLDIKRRPYLLLLYRKDQSSYDIKGIAKCIITSGFSSSRAWISRSVGDDMRHIVQYERNKKLFVFFRLSFTFIKMKETFRNISFLFFPVLDCCLF